MATIRKRTTRNGSTSFQAQVRKAGYEPVSRTFDSREEAAAWAATTELSMSRGSYRDAPESHRTTLSDAIDRYMREHVPRKKGARQLKNRCLAWQRHALAARPLAEVDGMALAKVRDEMLAQGRAASTVRNHLQVILHLVGYARREWGMTDLARPAIYVPQPPPDGRDRRLAPGEEDRLLDGAEYPLRQCIILAVETAMRAGEIRSLRWEWVDQGRRVATLPRTKNGRVRRVPLSSRALAAISSLPRQLSGHLFPRLSSSGLSHRFERLCRRQGVVDLRFHDLRHEATSRLVESGKFSMAEVMRITGHTTVAMLQRYYHPDAADLARRLG